MQALTPPPHALHADDVSGLDSPAAYEEKSLRRLWAMITDYAPYLHPSFICDHAWWKKHGHLPEAHVSSTGGLASFLSSQPSVPLQMFKHLLYRGLYDIEHIFNSGRALLPKDIRPLLDKANSSVEATWRDEDICFQIRLARCEEVVGPVVDLNRRERVGLFRPISRELPDMFSQAFKQLYNGDRLLLIGQADEQAYKVQGLYASKIENILEGESRRSHSRAITRLGKVYGRSSIPLLCMASVAGLWQLCCSPFYGRVLSLVGPPCPPLWHLADLILALQVDPAFRRGSRHGGAWV